MNIKIYNILAAFLVCGLWQGAAAQDALTDSRRTAVVRAVERVQPAVASIHVIYRERVWRQQTTRDPFWDLFFPRYVPTERERVGSRASGFVVTPDGYVLTNDHVIPQKRHLRRIVLSLPDGQSYEARHIGSDPAFDLAVLKIDATGLPVAPLGDSDDILVGEWALAIGNPFDLGPTVSIGVVSALDRDFDNSATQGSYYYDDMIQTDAAINQGNSGGPLVNALGEVIGINSFIYTGNNYSIGSIGIGFAIPINTARTFLQEVRLHGKVRIPWIGFKMQNLSRDAAEYFGLSSTDGAVVVLVAAGGPAERAGLERWDVIRSINGQSVKDARAARSLLERLRVDDEARFEILRDGKPLQLAVRLEEYPQTRARWY